MKYDHSSVRRQDRLLSAERAVELLHSAEMGVLSMVDADRKPYGVPVNYVYDGQSAIYIHCARQGRKLQALSACRDVSFCIVGQTQIQPQQFVSAYESIIVTGVASVDLPEAERREALRLLLEKYAPNNMENGLKFAEHALPRTEIIRIDMECVTGKSKPV